MFVLSYSWHGLILNDFDQLAYSRTLFIILFSIVYFGIGFILTLLYQVPYLEKKPLLKGLFFGCLMGILVYLISFVIGVSFIAAPTIKFIAIDAAWQVIEQSCGGLAIGLTWQYVTLQERRVV